MEVASAAKRKTTMIAVMLNEGHSRLFLRYTSFAPTTRKLILFEV